jgi:hypothetical protein
VKIYLASSWKNQRMVLALADILEPRGFLVDAFCRKAGDRKVSFHWSEMVDDEIELQKYDAISFLDDGRVKAAFTEDKKWLDWADAVIMVMPCGRSSHLEGGYAKGQGKLLYLFGDFPKGELDVMYRFADGLFRTEGIEELITALNVAGRQ